VGYLARLASSFALIALNIVVLLSISIENTGTDIKERIADIPSVTDALPNMQSILVELRMFFHLLL